MEKSKNEDKNKNKSENEGIIVAKLSRMHTPFLKALKYTPSKYAAMTCDIIKIVIIQNKVDKQFARDVKIVVGKRKAAAAFGIRAASFLIFAGPRKSRRTKK